MEFVIVPRWHYYQIHLAIHKSIDLSLILVLKILSNKRICDCANPSMLHISWQYPKLEK